MSLFPAHDLLCPRAKRSLSLCPVLSYPPPLFRIKTASLRPDDKGILYSVGGVKTPRGVGGYWFRKVDPRGWGWTWIREPLHAIKTYTEVGAGGGGDDDGRGGGGGGGAKVRI
eukprot:756064-Hanusia_phi.AAC.6